MEEKLTSAKLYRKIHKPFLEMGFLEFAYNHMYVKVVADGWYLSVVPNIHRFYNDQFTMEIFLSKETLLGDMYDHASFSCNLRPSDFLDKSHDWWWEGLRQESFDDFLCKFRHIVESQIITEINNLSGIVNESRWIAHIVNVNKGVCEEYFHLFGDPSLFFSSLNLQKPIKTPESWITAAEKYYECNNPAHLSSWKAGNMAFMEWMAREYASRMKK